MRDLPSGTVTFLFTDIEGSTKLAQEHPDEMPALLVRHNEILHQAIQANNGFVFRVVGDAFSGAFHTANEALNAALDVQRKLQNESWSPAPIKVRMGIHTGAAQLKDDAHGMYYEGYATLALTQRIMSVGHGGQILLSQSTHDLVKDKFPSGTELRDLGERQLKDIFRVEHLYQVVADDLLSDFPPLITLRSINHNLPPQLTSFIGRERELAEAQAKLTSAKLLTLIGPGGTGKTRLSLQIAAEQLPNFKDGVWLVELAPITDPALITSTIASVFELREIQNIPFISILLDYLRGKQLLLVLDNCEHLVEASAQIADQLLHTCPQLKIIASSREALGIDAETIFRVPSLSLPRDPADAQDLMDYESTRLFIERAMKAEPRFHVTDTNASAIAQICSRLDGIPLAIELAAARVKIFTPEQIAERLDDRFKLLTGGSRTVLPRQQTLRALIDWSYQSLNEIEQRVFRHLAVFSGGWTFEAAETVIGESEALDGLLGLINKSLVNVDEQDGASRYRFLETIRQYAMEKLVESGEATVARDRHLDYVLKVVMRSPQSIFVFEQPADLDKTEAEHDNLRTALEWATANHPEKALKLAHSVGGFWTLRDYNNEARTRCKAILEKTESRTDLEVERAQLYTLLGWVTVTMGEHRESRLAAQTALELAKKINDRMTMVRAYSILSLACIFLGDYRTAQESIQEGEKLARERGLKTELAMILSTHAQMIFFTEKDAIKSKYYLDESARLAQEAGYRWASSLSIFGLARVAAMLGDFDMARAKFHESAEIARRMGNKRIIYSSQSEFAHILREHGEIDEALGIYRDLLPKWKDLGHRAAVAHELECIAYILMRKEEPERAATLLGAAEALREAIDSMMTRVEQVEYAKEMATLRAGMDVMELQRSWSKGGSMTMDGAIEIALQG